jgi:hypothetical protein
MRYAANITGASPSNLHMRAAVAGLASRQISHSLPGLENGTNTGHSLHDGFLGNHLSRKLFDELIWPSIGLGRIMSHGSRSTADANPSRKADVFE